FRPVEVNRAVVRAVNILRTLLPRTVEVETQLAEGRLFVQADEMQLQQVLMNLCLNAHDAMPHGGRLEIKTRRDEQRNWLCLSVEDDGQGMTEEVRRRLFEPFFSTRERGTGLGLAIVHQIVTSFGGSLDVQSEPGRGTCFDVWLPLSG